MADGIPTYPISLINVALSQVLIFSTDEYQELNIANNPFNGKNVAVTGKLTQFTRDSINAKLESIGAKPVSGVTSKTDYLINNDATSQSSKNKKANELNIPIITENEFVTVTETFATMPDGVRLYTRYAVPKDKEKCPIVYIRTPYEAARNGT